MKRIILVLVVILISTNILHASNFRWTKIVTTKDRTTEFYIDKNSVKKVGKFHYYWMMSNYLKLEEGDNPNVKSTITSNILNCETSEFKSITLTSFNSNKGRGEIEIDVIIPDENISYFEWRYFGEETAFGRVFKAVCKTK